MSDKPIKVPKAEEVIEAVKTCIDSETLKQLKERIAQLQESSSTLTIDQKFEIATYLLNLSDLTAAINMENPGTDSGLVKDQKYLENILLDLKNKK